MTYVMGVAAQIMKSLNDHAVHRGSELSVSDEQSALTFSQLRESVILTRQRLDAKPGSRVLIDAIPSVSFVVLVLATHLSGHVAYPMSPSASAVERREVTRRVRPDVIISDRWPGDASPFRDLVILAEHPTLRSVVRSAQDEGSAAVGFMTSGSTGRPKVLSFSDKQVGFLTKQVGVRLRYRSADVVYCALPLSFDYGYYQIFLTLFVGAHLVLTSNRAVGVTARVLNDRRATVFPTVPTLLNAYLTTAVRAAERPPIRLVTSTGEAFPEPLQVRLAHVHPSAKVALMYGLTECKRVSIGTHRARDLPCSDVGTPLDGTHVEVVGSDGTSVPAGSVGEVVVAGPHVSSDAPLTETGRLGTGDLGRFDDQGRLHIVGRMNNEQVKVNGVRASRSEIERSALRVHGVIQAACSVDPSGAVTLWVAGDLSVAELRRGMSRTIDTLRIPTLIRIGDSLPIGVNGKFGPA